MSDLELCRIAGLVTLVVAALSLYSRWRSGTIFSGVAGLHANMLVYYGLGTIAYSSNPDAYARISFDRAMEAFIVAAPWMIGGYLAASIPDLRALARKPANQVRIQGLIAVGSQREILWAMSILAAIGYFGSKSEFATSGLGTIFPVLKFLQYPALVISIIACSPRVPGSVVLLLANASFSAFGMFYSGWRSEFIMLVGAIGLGLTIRNTRWLLPAGCAGLVLLILGLPFIQLKKDNYQGVMADPAAAWRSVADTPFSDRMDLLVNLWSFRLSGSREMAYVVNGLEGDAIERRNGDSYIEALLGLVPRVFWPDKPAFNLATNFVLPRAIGLLGKDDPSTSWGVNLYAEFVWNFGTTNLLWGVPLVFAIVRMLDRKWRSVSTNHTLTLLLEILVFFQLFVIVSVVNAVTYLLWSVIIVKVAALSIKQRSRYVAPVESPVRA